MQKKILIVDDDPAVLKAMARLMEAFDLPAITANSGRSAFELLKTRDDVSFIISDMRMPDGDGIEFLKMLRASGNNLPFLLLTGFADITTEEALGCGALAVMSKPFDTGKLIELIEAHAQK